MAEITIIVDNEAQEGLGVEHGLSFFIEAYNQRILFDTGKSSLFLENAKKLGVDLGDISFVFLSHNHNDHTGGLAYLSGELNIYTGKGILDKCYSRHDDNLLYDISMPSTSVEKFKSSKLFEVESFSEIAENIYSTGQIARDFPTYNAKFFYGDAKANCINDIADEQSMLLACGVLITGCCHSGLKNTIEACKKARPDIAIKTIIGGLHLLHCNDSQLACIATYLNTLGLEKVILLHCTGDNAKKYLSAKLNCQVILGKAGDTFSF